VPTFHAILNFFSCTHTQLSLETLHSGVFLTLLPPLSPQQLHVRNAQAIHWHHQHGSVQQVHEVQALGTSLEAAPGSAEFKWATHPERHTLRQVAIGARVMLTTTIDIPRGFTNGAFGTVVAVKFDREGVHIQAVQVHLDSTGERMTLKHSSVYKLARNSHSGSNGWDLRTFPMVLAYAIIAHKSQVWFRVHPTFRVGFSMHAADEKMRGHDVDGM